MNSIKIFVCVVGAVLVSVSAAYGAIKCYVCKGLENCEKPEYLRCNSTLADVSLTYLNELHTVLEERRKELTHTFYDCFHEDVHFFNGIYYSYRGCIYRYMKVCDMQIGLMSVYDDDVIRKCFQCNNRYGCNASDRRQMNVRTFFIALMPAIFAKILISPAI